MFKFKRCVAAAAMVVVPGTAQAVLVDRGGGMIYDSAQDITWLSDWNYAKTSGFDADGMFRSWGFARQWADNLVYGGFSDWRLPTVAQPDPTCNATWDPGGGLGLQYWGYHCIGSEMGHLFYQDLGGKAGESVLNQTGDTPQEVANVALFTNIQSGTPSIMYWTGTESIPGYVWVFDDTGGQVWADGNGPCLNPPPRTTCGPAGWYALAVRSGDVVAVPEPQALALMLLGLGAVGVAARRRRG